MRFKYFKFLTISEPSSEVHTLKAAFELCILNAVSFESL